LKTPNAILLFKDQKQKSLLRDDSCGTVFPLSTRFQRLKKPVGSTRFLAAFIPQ